MTNEGGQPKKANRMPPQPPPVAAAAVHSIIAMCSLDSTGKYWFQHISHNAWKSDDEKWTKIMAASIVKYLNHVSIEDPDWVAYSKACDTFLKERREEG